MKKPNIFIRILSFLFKVVVVLALMVVIAVGSFEGVTYYLTKDIYTFSELKKLVKQESDNVAAVSTQEEESSEEIIERDDVTTRVLFVESESSSGAKKQYVSLTILNTDTNAMDLILIPSNAQMTISQSLAKELSAKISDIGTSVELSDLANAASEERYSVICTIFENVLGIKINGYDVMTDENFIKFMNVTDEVTYTLENTISYRDSEGVLQYIEAGEQSFDGAGLYALMTYEDGTDSQESNRLQCVSDCLSGLFENLLAEKSTTVVKKYASLVQSSSEAVDETKGVTVVKALGSDDIAIRILQGNEADGVFTVDSQKAKLQVSALVKQAAGDTGTSTAEADSEEDTEEDGTETTTDGDSKDYSIELYNAAYVSGLAAAWEAYLEDEGYQISFIDSYQEEGPLSTTRIVVTEDGMGEDLLTYFPDAEIETGEIDTGGDIRIYIGTDGTDVDESYFASGTTQESDDDEYTVSDDEEEEDDEEDDGDSSYNFDTDSE